MCVVRKRFLKAAIALALVAVMASGMLISLGRKAEAQTSIQLNYSAGKDATINGSSVYSVISNSGAIKSITTVKPVRKSGGFNFAGWSSSPDTGIILYKSGQTTNVNITKSTTLYPVWQINLAFAAGDGAKINGNNVVMNVSTYVGKKLTIPSTIPVKSGYVFLGWTETKNGSTVQYEVGKAYSFYKPTTLWPVWTAGSTGKTCTLTFNVNKSKGESINTRYEKTATQSFTSGKAFTLKNVILKRKGYYLDGWATKEGGSKVYSLNASSVVFYKNTTLYPVWKPVKYEVTYHTIYSRSDGGSSNFTETKTANSGNKFTSVVPKFKGGLTLIGWGFSNPQSTDPIDKEVGPVFTKDDSIDKLADYCVNNYNNSVLTFDMYALTCDTGKHYSYKLGSSGIWYDHEGRAVLYLNAQQARDFAEMIASLRDENVYSLSDEERDTLKALKVDTLIRFFKTAYNQGLSKAVDELTSDPMGGYRFVAVLKRLWSIVSGHISKLGAVGMIWDLFKLVRIADKGAQASTQRLINSIYDELDDMGAYDYKYYPKNEPFMSIKVSIRCGSDCYVDYWDSNLMYSGWPYGSWTEVNTLSTDFFTNVLNGGAF